MRLNIDVANLRFFYVTTKFLEEKIPTIIPMIGIFYFLSCLPYAVKHCIRYGRNAYALAATEIQSNTQEQIPNATIPTVQMARANLVEHALWKVGNGLSLCLMNIAFTMSK